MSLKCVPFSSMYEKTWNELVCGSNHTILSTWGFLGYHNDRFEDQSVVFVDSESGYVQAVLPAAKHPRENELVVSHPGATFGGIIQRRIRPFQYSEYLQLALAHYGGEGFKTLRIKPPPAFVGQQADETATHHALRHATLSNCDLWTYLQLGRAYTLREKNYDIRKAEKAGVTCRPANTKPDWASFHGILRSNLLDRHKTTPVHELDELLDLDERLGSHSKLMIAETANKAICAGIWLLDYGNGVVHTQYICSTPEGRAMRAVDLLLADAINTASAQAYTIFSIGHCSNSDGWDINPTLLAYKLKFGLGVGLAYTFDFSTRERG